jgi:hypothetical protein
LAAYRRLINGSAIIENSVSINADFNMMRFPYHCLIAALSPSYHRPKISALSIVLSAQNLS